MDTIKFKKGKTRVVAHRGLSGIETENTCASFVAGCNRSYYAIETDIHRTLDGHFVINHDKNLNNVSGVNIELESSTLEELQKIILFDKDGTKGRCDLRPCILENYLNICTKYEKECVLELKSSFTDEEILKIIDIIKSFNYIDHVSFISFDYENLLKIRRFLPSHSVQFLFWKFTDEIFDRLIRDKIDIDIYYPSLTKEHIDKAHGNGLTVNCWTVNEKEDGERLASWGIDFITTNILE